MYLCGNRGREGWLACGHSDRALSTLYVRTCVALDGLLTSWCVSFLVHQTEGKGAPGLRLGVKVTNDIMGRAGVVCPRWLFHLH